MKRKRYSRKFQRMAVERMRTCESVDELAQPSVQGMDVYDGRLGILRDRIAFLVLLSTNYDALVSDGKDSVLIAITGTSGDGIAVADLSSILEPPPLPYVANAVSSTGSSMFRSQTKGFSNAALFNKKTPQNRRRVIPHVMNPRLFRLR